LRARTDTEQADRSLIYFAEEKKAHDLKMAKMDAEMRSVFEQKVQEKELKIRTAEAEVTLPVLLVRFLRLIVGIKATFQPPHGDC